MAGNETFLMVAIFVLVVFLMISSSFFIDATTNSKYCDCSKATGNIDGYKTYNYVVLIFCVVVLLIMGAAGARAIMHPPPPAGGPLIVTRA